MSNLIIEEENRWEIESAVYEFVRQALKNGLITKEDLEKLIYD